MDIGLKIKELRTIHNIKATDLAIELGISRVFLSNIENGSKKPSYETLEKICEYFNISLSEFFKEEEKELNPELIKLIKNSEKLSTEQLKLLNELINNYLKSDLK